MMRTMTPNHFPRAGRAAGMHGFTLIELMIGMTIGLIVLLGLTVFFSYNSRNQHDLERSIGRLENARFALDTLTEDLLHAGYYAQYVPALTATPSAIVTCPTTTANLGWNADATQMPPAVTGLTADPTDTTQSCLTNKLIPGTGVITVTRAETGDPVDLDPDETRDTDLYIQTTSCATGPEVIVNTGPEGNFTLQERDCATPKKVVHRLLQRTYFLSSCNDCTNNDGIPSLKRGELIGNKLIGNSYVINTVAEGVEQLQFEVGVDTNNDGQVDEVLPFAAITGDGPAPYDAPPYGADPYVWRNVMAVRVHMLTRSSLPDPGHTEDRSFQMGALTLTPADLPSGFKRTLLTTTVPLTNVTGRRE